MALPLDAPTPNSVGMLLVSAIVTLVSLRYVCRLDRLPPGDSPGCFYHSSFVGLANGYA